MRCCGITAFESDAGQENGPTMKDHNDYQILENMCATTPDNHHFLILHARNGRTEDIWAVGDD